MHFHCQPAMPRFSPDQQESPCTTAKQQPPQCLFPLISSSLLSLQSLTQGEQGSLEQPPLRTPASLISLLLLGFLDLAPLLLPRRAQHPLHFTGHSFSLTSAVLSRMLNKQKTYRHLPRDIAAMSLFCIRQVIAPTHTHLNSAPPALEFNLHTSSLIYNGSSYAKGKILLKFGPQHSSIQVPGLPLHYQSASPRASYSFSRQAGYLLLIC